MKHRKRRAKPKGSGFAVEGREFYVWQETRGEALAWARELFREPARGALYDPLARPRVSRSLHPRVPTATQPPARDDR